MATAAKFTVTHSQSHTAARQSYAAAALVNLALHHKPADAADLAWQYADAVASHARAKTPAELDRLATLEIELEAAKAYAARLETTLSVRSMLSPTSPAA